MKKQFLKLFYFSFSFFILALIFSVSAQKTLAATITVCPIGVAGQNGCDYIGGDGIQMAVEAAPAGSADNKTTILIKNGYYTRVGFTLNSSISSTVLHKCFISINNKSLILKGPAVLDGWDSLNMTGICLSDSNVEISGLYLVAFKTDVSDLDALCSDPCTYGDGILSNRSSLQIKSSFFVNNQGQGIYFQNGNMLLENSTILGNWDNGVVTYNSLSTIRNAIFAHQPSPDGYYWHGHGLICEGDGGTVCNLSYSNFYQNNSGNFSTWNNSRIDTGAGVIENSDPKFVDQTNRDYHLASDSPARNSGDPSILDPDGSRSDIGAFGGPSACNLDPNLPGCPVTIAGHVKNRLGQGVVSVPVQLCTGTGSDRCHNTNTDQNGYYSFDNLVYTGGYYDYLGIFNREPTGYIAGSAKIAAGYLKLRTWPSDYVWIDAGQEDYYYNQKAGNRDCGQNCDFTIDKYTTIAGHVKNSSNQTGVPNAWIQICDAATANCYQGEPTNSLASDTTNYTTDPSTPLVSVRKSDGYKFNFNTPGLITDSSGYYHIDNTIKLGYKYTWFSLWGMPSGYAPGSNRIVNKNAYTFCDAATRDASVSDYRCMTAGSGDCGQNCDFTINPVAAPTPTPTQMPTSTPTPTRQPSSTPTATPGPRIAEDINGDRCVSILDLNEWIYARNNGTPIDPDSRPDINDDGQYDVRDFQILLNSFIAGQNPCP